MLALLERWVGLKAKNPQRMLRVFSFAVRAGFEPAVQFPVRQFSKLVVSASHPPHRVYAEMLN